jgi:hypothetical protein
MSISSGLPATTVIVTGPAPFHVLDAQIALIARNSVSPSSDSLNAPG